MAENVLQAKITADISDLEKNLKKAESLQADYAKSISNTKKDIADNIAITKQYQNAINDLQKEYKAGNVSQKDFQKQLQRLKRDEQETKIETANLTKELSRLNSEQKAVAGAYPAMSKGSEAAAKSTKRLNNGAVEFGRLLGDLPYGIQGVANNIQQLSFVMGGSAGLQIVISIVTALMVAFNKELFASSDAASKLAGATAEFTANVKSELSTLQSLIAVANDETLSKRARQKAIDKINEEYPEYLGNLTLERIGTDEARIAVDKLTKSLILKARIQGLEKAIQETIADKEEDITDLALKRAAAYKAVGEELKNLKSSSSYFNAIIDESKTIQENVNAIGKAMNGFDSAQLRVLKSAVSNFKILDNQLNSTNKKLEEALDPLIRSQTSLQKIKFGSDTAEFDANEVVVTPKTKEKIKNALQEQAKLDKLTFEVDAFDLSEKAQEDANNVARIYEESGARIANAMQPENLDVFPGVEESFQNIVAFEKEVKKLQATLGEGFDGSGYTLQQLDALEQRLKNNAQAAKVFGDGVSAGMNAFANSITESLATGNKVLDAFVGAVVSSLAHVLSATISNNASMLAAKSASTSSSIALDTAKATGSAIAGGAESGASTGPGAIAAIPLMIAALVAVVGAAFSSIKFAHGGIVPGGSFVGDKIPAMLNSGEAIMNGKQQSNLLMAIANGNSSRMQSGQPSGGLESTTVIRGSDLLLTLKRAEKNNNRFGG